MSLGSGFGPSTGSVVKATEMSTEAMCILVYASNFTFWKFIQLTKNRKVMMNANDNKHHPSLGEIWLGDPKSGNIPYPLILLHLTYSDLIDEELSLYSLTSQFNSSLHGLSPLLDFRESLILWWSQPPFAGLEQRQKAPAVSTHKSVSLHNNNLATKPITQSMDQLLGSSPYQPSVAIP